MQGVVAKTPFTNKEEILTGGFLGYEIQCSVLDNQLHRFQSSVTSSRAIHVRQEFLGLLLLLFTLMIHGNAQQQTN